LRTSVGSCQKITVPAKRLTHLNYI
jgi:hypothetical protein